MEKRGAEKAKQSNHPVLARKWTFGERAADILTKYAGTWTFIVTVLIILAIWMYINVKAAIVKPWDPYPFILLNFVLSCLAALQAPIILMSQNRTSQRDRIRAEYDYKVNRQAEREIRELQKHIADLNKVLLKKRK